MARLCRSPDAPEALPAAVTEEVKGRRGEGVTPQEQVASLSVTPSPSPAARVPGPFTPSSKRPGRSNQEVESWLAAFVVSRDDTLRERLILHFTPLVRYLAMRFTNRGIPFEDLLQVGAIGLIRAVDRYDPRHSAKFITYAVPSILGEIKHYFRDHNWHVKAPRRLRDLYLLLASATEEHQRNTGSTPTVTELAERVGVGEEQVLAAMEVGSSFRVMTLPDGSTLSSTDADAWGDRLGENDEAFEAVEMRHVIEDALRYLSPRLRHLIELRYFHDQSQREVGHRLGISQMQVSRLERRALDRLRVHLRAAIE
jgi:RNA polymerase sigma-B factor